MRPINATFDIYLNGALATQGAAGNIRPYFALGSEFSEGHTAFRWTHILDVALDTDIRDQWPATPTGVYFILLPTDGELDEGECAERYNVVEIERIRDQRGGEFKRVYLNRECQGVAIRVKEVDGSPDYAGICELQFDQADGFVLSQPAAGKAKVKLTVSAVTSVGLSMPAEFSVSGSPVTSTGTLAVSKATQAQKTFWAGPTSGADAAPTFRTIASGDLPSDNPGGSFSGVSVPYWIKITKSHTAFQTAGTSKDVTVWTAAAKAFLHAIVIHASTTFAGAGFFSYTLTPYYGTNSMAFSISVLSGNPAAELTAAGQASSSSWPAGTQLGVASMTGSTDVKIQAQSFGANLDQSSAGSLDIYLLVSQMP